MASTGAGGQVKETLRSVARDLDELGTEWALVGGLAVSSRAEPRLTRDVDVAILARDDDAAEACISALQARGYRIITVIEQTAAGRLATVRLEAPSQQKRSVIVDTLFASSGIEAELVAAATRIEVFEDVEVPVATVGHLIALKLLARDDRDRPQDYDDIRALLAEASPTDLAQAKDAVELIVQRGFHRGRDLVASFASAVEELSP